MSINDTALLDCIPCPCAPAMSVQGLLALAIIIVSRPREEAYIPRFSNAKQCRYLYKCIRAD